MSTLHIPILRHGQPYESVDKITLLHHATGEPIAQVSQANAGLISRDVHRWDHAVLDQFAIKDLFAIYRRAADLFMNAALPIGDSQQTFDDYVQHLSATTGMPYTYCRLNAQKIHRVMSEIEQVVAGLTRGFDWSILAGFVKQELLVECCRAIHRACIRCGFRHWRSKRRWF